LIVGGTLPLSMRHYVVVNPVGYGLSPAPTGHIWCYAGTNFVLISRNTGVIIQSVAGGW
jgi:Ni/Co efflux regulator RcnB